MPQLKNSRCVVVCLISLALFLAAVPPPTTAQAPVYIITDLGTLGGSQSKAFGVNRFARVVGESDIAGGAKRPFSWDSGTLTDLTNFGGTIGSAYSVNDIGHAVGAADNAVSQTHPFIWSDIFDKKDLGTLSGGTFAIALDINNANQVVGQSEIGGPGVLQDRAFVWDRINGMQPIATLPGGSSNAANGINDSGQIVGYSGTSSGETHGFLLSGGVLTDIPPLGTGRLGIAFKINSSGQVVGYSNLVFGTPNPPHHAFLWTAGSSPLDLGTLGGNSIAHDINDAGEVVGSYEVTPGVNRAFIYTQSTGMTDLNSLTTGSGWTLLEARGVNNKGQIVGFGVNPSGFVHGFLLTPDIDDIPGGEPPPCAVVGASPIVLPKITPIRQERVRSTQRSSRPTSRRKPIYDLLKL